MLDRGHERLALAPGLQVREELRGFLAAKPDADIPAVRALVRLIDPAHTLVPGRGARFRFLFHALLALTIPGRKVKAVRQLLSFLRRFPQLNAVSLRVDHPSEFSELRLLGHALHGYPFSCSAAFYPKEPSWIVPPASSPRSGCSGYTVAPHQHATCSNGGNMTSSTLYIGIKGHVLALDRSTGSELWRTKLGSSDFTNVVVDGGQKRVPRLPLVLPGRHEAGRRRQRLALGAR